MAEKEKKRKRHEGGGERPSKKSAAAQPTGTVRVEFLENKEALGPVLGTRTHCQRPLIPEC
jgi:DNA-directed RNA polymerase I subunit RPA49